MALVPRFTVRHMTINPSMSCNFSTGPQLLVRGEKASGKTLDAATILEDEQRGVFRVLQVSPQKEERGGKRKSGFAKPFGGVPPPTRADSMKPDQWWGSVWPAARTFHPATVPLPVRQGVVQTKAQVVPSKWANAELMKIPNFLHLTPPVIKRHCAALSRFCTAWPQGLETEEEQTTHFPLTVTTSDHLNSSSSVRDRRARIVTLKFKLDSLKLDKHARDKFVRLVGDRFDEETGEVKLTADRCPYRGQNEDYATYLLTALFHESCVVEDWEASKEVADEEMFCPVEEGGREALEEILNKGEDEETVRRYKEEVRRLLGLPGQTVEATVIS